MKRLLFLFAFFPILCCASMQMNVNPLSVPADTVIVNYAYACPSCHDTVRCVLLYSASKDTYYKRYVRSGKVRYDAGHPDEECEWCQERSEAKIFGILFITLIGLLLGSILLAILHALYRWLDYNDVFDNLRYFLENLKDLLCDLWWKLKKKLFL